LNRRPFRGEEPDLLKLANSLAGVAASANWRAMVSEAGFRYVLLQANPTEKGTYIADESGYSIIAALMRGAEADVAYIVPSYHDPNASENRWHDFYAINESQSVRNYRVEALPVMFIERGVFPAKVEGKTHPQTIEKMNDRIMERNTFAGRPEMGGSRCFI
jgi:hypothetical protein